MNEETKILYTLKDSKTKEARGYLIYCSGCKCCHCFDGRWTFNNDFEKPTFSPSLLVKHGEGKKIICHSFVKNGQIQYLNDCTHSLAGKTIDLEPF